MPYLLAAKKNDDILSWRGTTTFNTSFRESLLKQLSNITADHALKILNQTVQELKNYENYNNGIVAECQKLLAESTSIEELTILRNMVAQYYKALYFHVVKFNSAVAFYNGSSQLLKVISRVIIRISIKHLGILDRHLPNYSLIALGPAGRDEYSPFCPLQLTILHDQTTEKGVEAIRQLGRLIHEGFETSGLRVDKTVSTKHNSWCCTEEEWIKRFANAEEENDTDDLIDTMRMADQKALAGDAATAESFKQNFRDKLSISRVALGNLVSRISLLSNGLGILGRLKLEKSGPYRGSFPLLDHALQPLTASVSAFALLSHLETDTTPDRIRELLGQQELDVDTAESLLHAWQTINELRLIHEHASQSNWEDPAPLHINSEKLSTEHQHSLRNALEAIGMFQHHLYRTFTAKGK